MKIKLTKEQKTALENYNFQVMQEDRYMGSVFVNAHGQRMHEEKVEKAYQSCKSLNMTHEHGL